MAKCGSILYNRWDSHVLGLEWLDVAHISTISTTTIDRNRTCQLLFQCSKQEDLRWVVWAFVIPSLENEPEDEEHATLWLIYGLGFKIQKVGGWTTSACMHPDYKTLLLASKAHHDAPAGGRPF